MEIHATFNSDLYQQNNDVALQAEITRRLTEAPAALVFEFSRQTPVSFVELLALVEKGLSPFGLITTRSFSPRAAIVGLHKNNSFVMVMDGERSHQNPWLHVERNALVQGYGDQDILGTLYKHLDSSLEGHARPTLGWSFSMPHGRQEVNITPAPAKPVHDAYYPWLGDVHAYQDRYVNSPSSVLILLGEPGTAKTSFVRSLMWRHSLSTMFTYDDKLLESDEMFVALVAGDTDLLVVEDADIFLGDRAHAGNRTMARFLNVSDGLAAGPRRKKIIFTANIMEQAKIDAALLRPGRCFDCSVFRRLTLVEAIAAAEVAGLPKPTEEKEYTLAELFATGTSDPTPLRPPRTGFTGLNSSAPQLKFRRAT